MTQPTRPGPKQRLLAAARVLSYRQGVAVGLDAILKEADVARRSVYQHFSGKDNLLAEAIATAAEADRAELAAKMAEAGESPRARVLAMLEFFLDLGEQRSFLGCRYVVADLSLPDKAHPVHQWTRAYYAYLHGVLVTELTELCHPDPTGTATRLQLIIDGALAQYGTRRTEGTAIAARTLFQQVLAESDQD